jgi:uncharacterized lipoprotein NlpE involved in copper resistance
MNTNLTTKPLNPDTKYQQYVGFLDKLGHLDQKTPPTPTNKGKDPLTSKAKKKFFTQELCVKLLETKNKTLHKSYLTTLTKCCKVMSVQGNKVKNAIEPDWSHPLTGKWLKKESKTFAPLSIYCKSRWCLICNNIKTAHLINSYLPIIKSWENPYFLTLTTELTPKEKAKEEIKRKLHTLTLITRKAKRQGHDTKLFRNVEATYNSQHNKFHIHIHCIVHNEELGKMILNEWLTRNNKQGFKCVEEAQCLKPADKNENSLKEIFKYATKMITKTKKGERVVFINALNELFIAFQNVRTFQAYGVKKLVDENKAFEELQADELAPMQNESGHYVWNGQNWQGGTFDELLSCYEPDNNMIKLINSFVLNKNDTS